MKRRASFGRGREEEQGFSREKMNCDGWRGTLKTGACGWTNSSGGGTRTAIGCGRRKRSRNFFGNGCMN
jgi:hypothetical protein